VSASLDEGLDTRLPLVADAYGDGKERLMKKWASEAEVCRYEIPAGHEDDLADESADDTAEERSAALGRPPSSA
jgi:hypothetical protein